MGSPLKKRTPRDHAVLAFDGGEIGGQGESHPMAAMAGEEELRQGRAGDAGEQARFPLDHHHFGAEGPGGGRRLQADVAAADHRQLTPRPQPALQRSPRRRRCAGQDAVEFGAGQGQLAGPGAGGQDQLVVGDERPALQLHPLADGVDAGDAGRRGAARCPPRPRNRRRAGSGRRRSPLLQPGLWTGAAAGRGAIGSSPIRTMGPVQPYWRRWAGGGSSRMASSPTITARSSLTLVSRLEAPDTSWKRERPCVLPYPPPKRLFPCTDFRGGHGPAGGHHRAGPCARGEAVCLWGPLGAGKSTLARGLVRALTTDDEDVPSPTFTLVAALRGRHSGGSFRPLPAKAAGGGLSSWGWTRRWTPGRR